MNTFAKPVAHIGNGLLLGLLTLFMLALPKQDLSAASGEEIFKSLCAPCHRTDTRRTVGPGLKGVSEKRGEEWVRNWIIDNKAMIQSGDPDAVAVWEEYKIDMPPFKQISDAEMDDLILYMEVEGAKAPDAAEEGGGAAAIPTSPSPPVDSWIETFILWGIIFVILLTIVAVRLASHTKRLVESSGLYPDPHRSPNHGLTFLLILSGMLGVTWLLARGLEETEGMLNTLVFAALPYAAIGVFIVGSIIRYRNRGFQVSSLSTQFLEGKKLFWGSQPFHWGIMFLFFGHLIAFLFPRSLILWNGSPIRLLIIETSAFIFGLSALIGLILLISRRFSSKRLTVTANKMDMLVYATLLLQIGTGLGIAFFERWGSTWFAAVLTPYLRSLFVFSPEIEAVSAMPWLTQVHIVSAFFIIAIIPFTRFMHFLVVPIAYIWRSYQVVIWNWNRSMIRNSKRHTFGRKPRNH